MNYFQLYTNFIQEDENKVDLLLPKIPNTLLPIIRKKYNEESGRQFWGIYEPFPPMKYIIHYIKQVITPTVFNNKISAKLNSNADITLDPKLNKPTPTHIYPTQQEAHPVQYKVNDNITNPSYYNDNNGYYQNRRPFNFNNGRYNNNNNNNWRGQNRGRNNRGRRPYNNNNCRGQNRNFNNNNQSNNNNIRSSQSSTQPVNNKTTNNNNNNNRGLNNVSVVHGQDNIMASSSVSQIIPHQTPSITQHNQQV